MKKATLFALAALCVSAAQALTVTWSGNETKTIKDVDYSKTITIVYDYTLDANISGRNKLLEMAFNGGTLPAAAGSSLQHNSLEFRNAPAYGGPNLMTFGNEVNYEWHTALAGSMNAGTHQLTLVIDFANKKYDYTWGETSGSVNLYSSTINNGELVIGQFGAAGNSISVTYNEAGTVPEPTALALLALGVAGLALKRKNA